jgi:hypothetical protein
MGSARRTISGVHASSATLRLTGGMQAVDAGVGEDAGDAVDAAFQSSADQLSDVGDVANPPGGEGVEPDDGEE